MPVPSIVKTKRKTPKDFTKAKVGVGSIKIRSDYDEDERAFHASEMPRWSKSRRMQVLEWKKTSADQLGLLKPFWNADCSIERPRGDKRQRQIAEFDRTEFKYNYRSEVLPRSRPVQRDAFGRIVKLSHAATKRVEEMPVHPALAGKPKWNVSTQITDEEKETGLDAVTARSMASTRRMARGLAGYVGPTERERLRMTELRGLRAAEGEARRTGQTGDELTAVSATSRDMRRALAAGQVVVPAVTSETRGRQGFALLPTEAAARRHRELQEEARQRAGENAWVRQGVHAGETAQRAGEQTGLDLGAAGMGMGASAGSIPGSAARAGSVAGAGHKHAGEEEESDSSDEEDDDSGPYPSRPSASRQIVGLGS